MAQRAQILVQVKNQKGLVVSNMYHLQWGQGRILMMQLMNLVIKQQLVESSDIFSSTNLDRKTGATDISNCIFRNKLKNLNVDDLSSVKDCFDDCENEEGGLVIEITENEYDFNTRIGFLLVDEKESIQPKYVTLDAYIKRHGYKYVGCDFKKMFKYFLKSFDIEVMLS